MEGIQTAPVYRPIFECHPHMLQIDRGWVGTRDYAHLVPERLKKANQVGPQSLRSPRGVHHEGDMHGPSVGDVATCWLPLQGGEDEHLEDGCCVVKGRTAC